MAEIRPSRPEEIPLQKQLWKRCFGDSNAYIDHFYEKFCTADQVLVVEQDGGIDSMAAVLPATLELSDSRQVPVGYVYALATNPNAQGKGNARHLLSYADKYIQEKGMKAMVLVPASPSLHRFFDALGMSECFGIRKVELLKSSFTGNTEGTSMVPIGPEEYNAIRESFLMGTFHMTYTDHMISLQQFSSQLSRGDLFRIQVDDEVGCAAIEYVQSRRLLVKELIISPDKMSRAMEAIAAEKEASGYHVRTPAFWDGINGSYLQAFGMIKWYDHGLKNKWFSHQDAYLGLAFD